MSTFSLKWKIEKNFPVILLNGDITSEADQLLEEAYYEIRNQIKEKIYIFDFENANYINSSGTNERSARAIARPFLVHLHRRSDPCKPSHPTD
jgi:hypothetical protein